MQIRNAVFRAAPAICCAIMAGAALPATAQQTPQSERDTINLRTDPIPQIEVTGERPLTQREISRNVYQLAQSNETGAPIPRFHDPLCLSVSGLGQVLSKEVRDLILENAAEASMEIDAPGCTANALVIVVDNPERLIERLREERPQMFDVRAKGEIRAAISRNDPVIAWSKSAIRNSRGEDLSRNATVAGAAGTVLFDNPAANVPTTDTFSPSRYRISYSVGREISVVVFDVRQLEDVHLNQLADYATMFLIGSPRRLLDFEKLEGDSILSLFRDGPWEAPIGLTQLDRAYLRGLYSLKPNENSSRLAASTRVAYTQIVSGECGSDREGCKVEDG